MQKIHELLSVSLAGVMYAGGSVGVGLERDEGLKPG